MMIKKVDTSFFGGSKGAKTSDFGTILRFKPLICQSVAYPPTPPNLQKRCISVFYNIPLNFKAKVWQENFIWEKINIPLSGW